MLLLRLLENSSAFPTAFTQVASGTSSSSAVASAWEGQKQKIVSLRTWSTAIFANPLQNIFGNVASSISNIQQQGLTTMSSDESAKMQALASDVLASHHVGSWEDIRSSLESKQTPEEKSFRNNLANGYGKASPLHKIRLYDESNKEEDVRVTLYRDSASWCPYCQKVWTMLEAKKICYKVEKINMRCYGEKPGSFQRLQPNGAIPVAISKLLPFVVGSVVVLLFCFVRRAYSYLSVPTHICYSIRLS